LAQGIKTTQKQLRIIIPCDACDLDNLVTFPRPSRQAPTRII